MTIIEEILMYQNKISELEKRKKRFLDVLSNLKVGDIVYEEGSHGFDLEYFPQRILEIDFKGCRLFTHEESIDKKQWVHCFCIRKEDGDFERIY